MDAPLDTDAPSSGARRPDLVARDAHDLTAEWLAEALGTTVRSVTVERVGSGQTGATYRLSIDADDVPATIVAKIAAGDDDSRRRVWIGYRREVGFYRELAGSVDVRTPRCWHAAISEESLGFTLLLEDLHPREAGVQAEGCSIDQALDAVRNLAGLHAARWNDETLYELDFVERRTSEAAAFLAAVVTDATAQFVDRYEADLDAADVSTLEASARALEAWELSRPEPFAILHGDYRLDNLLFPPSSPSGAGAEVASDVVAVDWQTLVVGPPARDLAYFLGTSLEVADRRSSEADLVAAYHRSLVERGVTGYELDRCFDDYRVGHLQAPMITTLGAIFATRERSERADEMFVAMARRACAAIRDLGTLDGC
jgi:aminoglycoside phosphotransferase (APT) family kinase protein